MRALIDMLAARSGGLLVPGKIASELAISQHTVNKYFYLLEEVFLIKRVPALIRNLGTRTTKTPKVAMVDSGIAAATGEPFRRTPRGLRHHGDRQLPLAEVGAELFHYRTKDQVEVDIVLQTP